MTKPNLLKRFACGCLLCPLVGVSLRVLATPDAMEAPDAMEVPDPTVYELRQPPSSEPSIEGKGKRKPGDTQMPSPEPGIYDPPPPPPKPFPGISNKPVSPRDMPAAPMPHPAPIPDTGIY